MAETTTLSLPKLDLPAFDLDELTIIKVVQLNPAAVDAFTNSGLFSSQPFPDGFSILHWNYLAGGKGGKKHQVTLAISRTDGDSEHLRGKYRIALTYSTSVRSSPIARKRTARSLKQFLAILDASTAYNFALFTGFFIISASEVNLPWLPLPADLQTDDDGSRYVCDGIKVRKYSSEKSDVADYWFSLDVVDSSTISLRLSQFIDADFDEYTMRDAFEELLATKEFLIPTT